MIAFSQLGAYGRLGNQLFQYAFIRTLSRRQGLKFYCPPWVGDAIFDLDDAAERTVEMAGIVREYRQSPHHTGYDPEVWTAGDGTDFRGYFQSERYFDTAAARQWFRFKPSVVAAATERYRNIDFDNTIGVHLRLGDFLGEYRLNFYVARPGYYRRALALASPAKHVLVFSDDVSAARELLKEIVPDAILVETDCDYESLHLQSRCRDLICSPSTFSWWGAWLNPSPTKRIFVPREGPFRPGAWVSNEDFWPESWQKLGALWPFVDHRRRITLESKVAQLVGRVRAAARR